MEEGRKRKKKGRGRRKEEREEQVGREERFQVFARGVQWFAVKAFMECSTRECAYSGRCSSV